jgi:uncharacterized protein
VILADSHQEKLAVINESYRSYLERDTVHLLRIERSEAFTNLVRVLATQSGKLVILSELASTLGISMATVKTYLWYLEKPSSSARPPPILPIFENN